MFLIAKLKSFLYLRKKDARAQRARELPELNKKHPRAEREKFLGFSFWLLNLQLAIQEGGQKKHHFVKNRVGVSPARLCKSTPNAFLEPAHARTWAWP